MRFLAIGECMAELAPAEGGRQFALGFAGDTFNTTWYMARCLPGSAPGYFTAIGEDRISGDLRAFMENSGIDTTGLQTRADQTLGLYLITLDKGERSFSYWRGQSAARSLMRDPTALTRAAETADVLFFSGITLAILDEPQRQSLFDILRQARAEGRSVAFDPNLRPKLWSSAEEMCATIAEAATCADTILPSYEDEAAWFGDKSPEDTLQRYLDAGARCVVVKNGAEDVIYAEGDTRGQVAVTALAQPVDTTAAGDSFNAGFFAGRARGLDLGASIQAGCQLSRYVVQHRGALVDVPPEVVPALQV